jgi:hypothetical protein
MARQCVAAERVVRAAASFDAIAGTITGLAVFGHHHPAAAKTKVEFTR